MAKILQSSKTPSKDYKVNINKSNIPFERLYTDIYMLIVLVLIRKDIGFCLLMNLGSRQMFC